MRACTYEVHHKSPSLYFSYLFSQSITHIIFPLKVVMSDSPLARVSKHDQVLILFTAGQF